MTDLPTIPIISDEPRGRAGQWWSTESDGKILCELCPRACRLHDGDSGFCFVRSNRNGKMVLDTYGRSTGFCIDPIEKKPLNHFFPGTPVLSFGTAGCNLGCKFCQNWDISKSREVARLSDEATPDAIALAAQNAGCKSVAYTYNDPVIWAEYAIDTANACRQLGIKSVAVTAGYITPKARGDFFGAMDAANIDLKAFTEDFYFKLTSSHLEPVLDTIRFACNETDTWIELTNLIIPDANDSPDELQRMCDWILEAVGPDVPVHFTAFHPDFRMLDRERTDHDTLIKAYDLARQSGLRYVYVGNVHDVSRQSTYCPGCGHLLIQRDWHQLGTYSLDENRCHNCNYEVAGHFETQPGAWGRKRQPIRIAPVKVESETDKEATMPADADISDESYSDSDRKAIHFAASRLVTAAVRGQQATDELAPELAEREIDGVYVTLKRGKTLRGCCGLQGQPLPLKTALAHSAHRTATSDPRMAPISETELPFLDLSVSILGPPRPIGVQGDDRVEAVVVGKHGLRIQLGNQAGLLLPSVAREQAWNSRQFLDAVCRKAGLPAGSWRHEQANLEIFDGIDFGAPLQIDQTEAAEISLIPDNQIQRYANWVRTNLGALQTGATPMYYAVDVDDATVSGVALRVYPASGEQGFSWLNLVLRDGLPLQSTLFQMTEVAARTLGQQTVDRVDIAVFSNPIQHGTSEDTDLRGIDCCQRAIIARDTKRVAMSFDQNATPEGILNCALESQAFRKGSTQIFSVVCDCSSTDMDVSIGPVADSSVTTRQPGVAGTFYPADDVDREHMIDDLIADLPTIESKQTVATAMVPHAGLRFSGTIAADVWRRIDLPKTIIIIGPKHTSDGVDWAVAPHDEWKISATASMPGDPEMAQQLADAVPAMELDATAHAREHGIEVQLPIIYRIAPQTKIVGVAISGGTIDELKESAKALAAWLNTLDEQPLLVISSDMNHFADDTENRRRDELALAQLQANAPEMLLQVCADESISMCGQAPAALVLLTMKELGQSVNFQKIAYGTSADFGGDKQRVVGYAGVLF